MKELKELKFKFEFGDADGGLRCAQVHQLIVFAFANLRRVNDQALFLPNLNIGACKNEERSNLFQQVQSAEGLINSASINGGNDSIKQSRSASLLNFFGSKMPNQITGQINLDTDAQSRFRQSLMKQYENARLSLSMKQAFASLAELRTNNSITLQQAWAILLLIYANKSQNDNKYQRFFDILRDMDVLKLVFPEYVSARGAASLELNQVANFLNDHAKQKTQANQKQAAKDAFGGLGRHLLSLFAEVSYLVDALDPQATPKEVRNYQSSDYIAQVSVEYNSAAQEGCERTIDDKLHQGRYLKSLLAPLLNAYNSVAQDNSAAEHYIKWAQANQKLIKQIEDRRVCFANYRFENNCGINERITTLIQPNQEQLYRSSFSAILYCQGQLYPDQKTIEGPGSSAGQTAPLEFESLPQRESERPVPVKEKKAALVEEVTLSDSDRQAMVCAAFEKEQWKKVKANFSINSQPLTDKDLTSAIAHWAGASRAQVKIDALASAKDKMPSSILNPRALRALVALVDKEYAQENAIPEQGSVLGECAKVFQDKAYFFGGSEKDLYKPAHLQATTHLYTIEHDGARALLSKIQGQSTFVNEEIKEAVISQAKRLAGLYYPADGELILCKMALLLQLLEQGFLNNEDWNLLTNHRNQGMLAWGESQTKKALGRFKNQVVKISTSTLNFAPQRDDNNIKTQYENILPQELKAYVGDDLSPEKVAAAAIRIRQMHACLTEEDFNLGTERVGSDALFAEDFSDLGEKLDAIGSKQARDEKQADQNEANETITVDSLLQRLERINCSRDQEFEGAQAEAMKNCMAQVQSLTVALGVLKTWPNSSAVDQRFKAQQLKVLAEKVKACEDEYLRLVGDNPELLDYLQGNAQNRTDEGDLAAQAKLQNMRNFLEASEDLEQKHGRRPLSDPQTFNHNQTRSMFVSLQQHLRSYNSADTDFKQVLTSLSKELCFCQEGLSFNEAAISLSFQSSINKLLLEINEINNLDCLKPLDVKYYVYRLEHLRRGIVAWSNQFLGIESSHEEFFNSSDILKSLTHQLRAVRQERLDIQASLQPSIRSSRGSSITSGRGNSRISGGSGSTASSRGSGTSIVSSLGSESLGNFENQEYKRSVNNFIEGDASTEEMVHALVRSLRKFPSSFGFKHIKVSSASIFFGTTYTRQDDLKRALTSQLKKLVGPHVAFADQLLGGCAKPGVFYRVYRVLSQFGASDKDYTGAALVELLSINDGIFWDHAAKFFESAASGGADFLSDRTNKNNMLFYLNALHYLVGANAIDTQESQHTLALIKSQIRFLCGLTNDGKKNGENFFQSHLGGSSDDYNKYFSVIFSDQSRPSSPLNSGNFFSSGSSGHGAENDMQVPQNPLTIN